LQKWGFYLTNPCMTVKQIVAHNISPIPEYRTADTLFLKDGLLMNLQLSH
jgi:hypothetical protein